MEYKAIRKCRWDSCGRTFTAVHPRHVYCSPACRRKAKRESMRKYQESCKKIRNEKSTRNLGYAPRTTSTLSDAVIDLEAYNRTHGTNYSYGQAVAKGII